jgi:hypothetical protein
MRSVGGDMEDKLAEYLTAYFAKFPRWFAHRRVTAQRTPSHTGKWSRRDSNP